MSPQQFSLLFGGVPSASAGGDAPGKAAEVGWDTIHPQMGGMLLMVATNRHHGMLAVLGAKDGLEGALFHLWTADA